MSREALLLGFGLVWGTGGGLGVAVWLPGRLSPAPLVLGFSAWRRYSPDARFSDDLNGLKCRRRRRSLLSSSIDLREYRWSFGGGQVPPETRPPEIYLADGHRTVGFDRGVWIGVAG